MGKKRTKSSDPEGPLKKRFKRENVTVQKKQPSRCRECRQFLDDTISIFCGDSENAVEEFIAISDPRLCIYDESSSEDYSKQPQYKITDFIVYDKLKHICPFDSGQIERNVELFFSGSIKPIYDENPDPTDGVATRELGPINSWWIAGFDGGQNAIVGLSTAYAEYILMEPSAAYRSFTASILEKAHLSKVVIDFCEENPQGEFEDLVNEIETSVPPLSIGCTSFSVDHLMHHSQFIVEQVENYDQFADPDEDLMLMTPCMGKLIDLAGVTLGKRKGVSVSTRKKKEDKKGPSKATTTPLVRKIFEQFFTDQLAGNSNPGPMRRRRCGVCVACQLPDCGACSACKDMVKFGGSGRSKQCCVHRRCSVMVIGEVDDEEEVEAETTQKVGKEREKKPHSKKETKCRVKWVGESVEREGKKFYSLAVVNGEEVREGDCVLVTPERSDEPIYIARVISMWEKSGGKYFHATWFSRGGETVLGETSNPRELFVVDSCGDAALSALAGKVSVQLKTCPSNWRMLGGLDDEEKESTDEKWFYQKWYDEDTARFEDIPSEYVEKPLSGSCPSCARNQLKNQPPVTVGKPLSVSKSLSEYSNFEFSGEKYSIGDSVYLPPDTHTFPTMVLDSPVAKCALLDSTPDETTYPEVYRKTKSIKGSNEGVPKPFQIGRIVRIFSKQNARDLRIVLEMFYRPEDTHKSRSAVREADLNLVYWGGGECQVEARIVQGKCHVVSGEELPDNNQDWFPDNCFYFHEAYDSATRSFVDPPSRARSRNKGKGKGKGVNVAVSPVESATPFKPLRTLDVFAGCGGLSAGFHQCGLSETAWAVEIDQPAAQAYRLNNPEATVFTEDCNFLLRLAMEGAETNNRGQKLPRQGEVDLLCGGPPCQGFSGMNRFNSGKYSQFKNSLVVSYLSFCDYYRPRYFLLENVRNFVSFKRNMVLKLTLRCLLKMGYQVSFGVLQAGQYGVPQTRRRTFILAAAPGEKLPRFPEPTHCFSPRGVQLSVVVDGKKVMSNISRISHAPLRTITVWDALSDLPEITNGASAQGINYEEALSHFQRLIRGKQSHLCDHICKPMMPLMEARIRLVPLNPGSDWRDLPNIVTRLSDGSYTKKLIYTHNDVKNGKAKDGSLRGVCSCAEGKPCDPIRQDNTLIPWCLPHKANDHNQWAGLFGRLEWEGFFSTTITDPQPMSKQGRIVHPEQHRVVSVRECARSQGFPDSYKFFGNIKEKHRQIGNAVPPPMARAIGIEIKRACLEAAKCHGVTPS